MPGKPDLDAEFAAFTAQEVRIRCATCKMPEDIRTWVEHRMIAGDTNAVLARFLTSKGVSISASGLANHRAHAIAR